MSPVLSKFVKNQKNIIMKKAVDFPTSNNLVCVITYFERPVFEKGIAVCDPADPERVLHKNMIDNVVIINQNGQRINLSYSDVNVLALECAVLRSQTKYCNL